jgi:predicted DNA-binding transcriptional regulator AlpA
MATHNGLLTVNQFLAEMQVSRTTAYLWRKRGVGPRYVTIGSGPKAAVRYLRSDCDRFVRENAAR